MNPQEFVDFWKGTGGGQFSPPANPFKNEWHKIKNEIEPHFYGTVPPALEEAFPNEDREILAYRKKTYKPKTESPLVKAINDLSRLITGSKYSVYFDNQDMHEWLDNTDFSGEGFVAHFFKMVIPYRVLDPNAVFLLNVPNSPESRLQSAEVVPQIISSDRVIFYDTEYPLLIYKGETKKKYTTGFQMPIDGYYKIVTDQFYGEIVPINSSERVKGEDMFLGGRFRIIYEHNLGFVPFTALGGRPVPRYDSFGNQYVVYKSDFSAAIPYLDDASVYDNQHKSVMLARCFPIAFIEGITCQSCNGQGYQFDPAKDEKTSCKSCHGTGKTPYLSPLAGYYLSPAPTRIGDDKPQIPDPIRYYSPETATIEMTSKEAKYALDKAENVLNINRSLKQAQSGVAKELDKEHEYIEVGKISTDLFQKLKHILEALQGLLFLDITSEVSLSAPISFDLKNEVELLEEFQKTQMGMPASVRYDAFLSYVAQRYNTDNVAKRLAEIVADYSVWTLYTIEEKIRLLASGGISTEDYIKSNFAFEVVKELYYARKLSLELDTVQYKQIIDNALADRLQSAQRLVLDDVEDLNLEDEEQ
jgi:hypothetical protein